METSTRKIKGWHVWGTYIVLVILGFIFKIRPDYLANLAWLFVIITFIVGAKNKQRNAISSKVH